MADRPALVQLVARAGPLLVLAAGLEFWLMRLIALPEESYTQPLIVAELGRRLISGHPAGLASLGVIVAAAAVAGRARSLGPRWSDFEHAARLRGLIVLVAVVLAWVYATYPYNFYFGQAHHLDRLLLVALAPLIWWRPVFVFPFLLVLLPVLRQFVHPIGGFSWAAPMLPIRVLFLFGGLWMVRTIAGRARSADFVFLLCCMIAAHYWVSGVGKLQIGWPMTDRIAFLLPATYANGWLGFLAPEAISALTRTLLALNWPMKVATLLIECGAIFALWRRGGLRILLVAFVGLHGAIVLTTGIFFWTWMLLNIALLFLFFWRGAPPLPIFTRAHFLLSLVLIGGGALWFRPQELAWLDSRVSYTYRLEAVGESGRSYSLPPRFFSPYDYQFTVGSFQYLTPTPHMAITWGATFQRELAAALDHATSAGEVLTLEAEMGRDAFDPERSATFDRFVQRFVGRWNEPRGGEWWRAVQAPPLLLTFGRGDPPTAADPIARVVVLQVTSLFDDQRYLEIRERQVRLIPLRPE